MKKRFSEEQIVTEKFDPRVSAYLRKDRSIYICAESLLKGIAGVPDEPYFRLSNEDNVESIGSSILTAKNGSSGNIQRENYRDYVAPYVEMAGLSTYAQFAKNTKLVVVEFDTTVIQFLPSTNKRGVWYGMPDGKIEIPVESSATRIGETLMEAFSIAVV